MSYYYRPYVLSCLIPAPREIRFLPHPVFLGPTNLTAVQEGPTSIRVSWSPPTSLGDITGYRIYYSGTSSGSVDVSDGSTDNYLLTGLQNGGTYNISIVTIFSSNIGIFLDTLGKNDVHCVQRKLCTSYPSVPAPGQPSVNVTSITATSISFSWSVPCGTIYEVMWRALSSGDDGDSGTSGSITSTSYTIQDLKSNTVYSVTVTVTIAAGTTVSQPIIITSMWPCDFATHT